VPTYQYVCTNPEDKHEFEVVQSFSDPSLTECPQCGSPVRKVYGSVGVVFKGSGFYRTDSRAGSSSGGGDAANGAAAKEKKESGGKGSSPSSSSGSSAGSSSGSSPSSSAGAGTASSGSKAAG
jgi:putative FmdB family regulatory protein